ncbi:unnamed protein product [Thlaspi arvense]|uniref:Ferredoxin n=1 Tax=Thlaspi arvense TaxID=13288 RepID=A0AAU9T3V0_THLAR|nr:unnamed protein product [Thlaspi arvense]
MLFHRLSRIASRIVKELPRESHFSICGRRFLQRSYGQYLQSSVSLSFVLSLLHLEFFICFLLVCSANVVKWISYLELMLSIIVIKSELASKSLHVLLMPYLDLKSLLFLLFDKAVLERQTRTFQEALLSNSHKFCTSFSTASEKGCEETEKINVIFVDKDGEEIHVKVPIGMNILEAAHQNDIELEGTIFFHFFFVFALFWACEGSLACSTCHVIVMDTEYYNKLEEPTDEENDMLDLAFGLTETSVLSLSYALNGVSVKNI